MNLNTINHIAIIVSNFEKSKDFYVNKLEFKIITQIDRKDRNSSILYLEAGDIIIELFSFPNPPQRLSYPEACGLRHLAFTVKNFDKTIDKLTALGIEVEDVRIDERTGKKMTFFKDPDDLPLELCEE
jgi:glyoxylase I family protein